MSSSDFHVFFFIDHNDSVIFRSLLFLLKQFIHTKTKNNYIFFRIFFMLLLFAVATIRHHHRKNQVKQIVSIQHHRRRHRQPLQLAFHWGLAVHQCQTIPHRPPHHLHIILVYPKNPRDQIITLATVIVPLQPQLLMLSIHCHSLVV